MLIAIPDLIRLVHGNMAGINKLVREFRTYWKRKVTGKLEISQPNTPASGQPASNTDLDTSMEVDSSDNAVKNTAMETEQSVPETPESGTTEHFISKRQLEKKIANIAVREKRSNFKKTCWYVNEKLLEQHDLTSLPVPSQWEFISIPNPKTPGSTPTLQSKVEDVSTSPAARKPNARSITQFARPMSPSELAAQQAAVAQKIAQETAVKQAAIEEKQRIAIQKRQLEIIAQAQARASMTTPNNVINNTACSSPSGKMPALSGMLIKSPQTVKQHTVLQGMLAKSPQTSKVGGVVQSPKSTVVSTMQGKAVKSPQQTAPPKRRITPIMISPQQAKADSSKPTIRGMPPSAKQQKMASPASAPKRITPIMLSGLPSKPTTNIQAQAISSTAVKVVSAPVAMKPTPNLIRVEAVIENIPRPVVTEPFKSLAVAGNGDNSSEPIVLD